MYEIDDNHKLVDVEFVPTSKMGPQYITPVFIVMHYTAGYTFKGDVNTLSKTLAQGGRDGASAHVNVGKAGEVAQIVPFNRKAWHAGPSEIEIGGRVYTNLNINSIGIEITNQGYLQPVREVGGRNLYQDYAGNQIWGDGTFKNGRHQIESAPDTWLQTREVHPVIGKPNLVWEPFYEPQLDAVEGIVIALIQKYPTIKYIVSHEQIDTRGWKSDPGPAFPMRRFTKLTESRADDGDEPIAEAV